MPTSPVTSAATASTIAGATSPLAGLPLSRENTGIAPMDILWPVLLLAAVAAAVVALRRRRAGAAAQSDGGTGMVWQGWLGRMTGRQNGALSVAGTVRLGHRGELHVVRWRGEELLIGTGPAGAPTLLARQPVVPVGAIDNAMDQAE